MNADTHEVTREQRTIDLTQREFELLEYLMRNERIVISRQRLLDEVWGYDPFSTTNTIEVFVSNLRRKLEAEGEPDSCTRSAEPVTSFVRSIEDAVRRAIERISGAFDGLPIRVRLAGVSALLTFVILCAFALAVGGLTVRRIRSDFNRQVAQTAQQLSTQLNVYINPITHNIVGIQPALDDLPGVPQHSVIKLYTIGGTAPFAQTPVTHAPTLPAPPQVGSQTGETNGYRFVSEPAVVRVLGSGRPLGQVIVQYGRRVSDVDATIARVELLLLLGTFAGSAFALLAGIMIARRAMAPIAELTSAAEQIARTRDSSRKIPQPKAEDEVAELSRTLEGMLRELDSAHTETEAMLARQRRFVADASHELRTPLTSVLANLELLADSLHGEEGDAARSALRSSQRMRRLVADLLLLARTDVGRVVAHEPCDLAQIVVEAAAELGPVERRARHHPRRSRCAGAGRTR